MKKRVRQIRALLEDGMYPIDERLIADAILARVTVRSMVPEAECPHNHREFRSFRHDPSARSFRLARSPARSRVFH
jgi:hypothetical protein